MAGGSFGCHQHPSATVPRGAPHSSAAAGCDGCRVLPMSPSPKGSGSTAPALDAGWRDPKVLWCEVPRVAAPRQRVKRLFVLRDSTSFVCSSLPGSFLLLHPAGFPPPAPLPSGMRAGRLVHWWQWQRPAGCLALGILLPAALGRGVGGPSVLPCSQLCFPGNAETRGLSFPDGIHFQGL